MLTETQTQTINEELVIDVPNFNFGPQAEGKQGAAEKPVQMKP